MTPAPVLLPCQRVSCLRFHGLPILHSFLHVSLLWRGVGDEQPVFTEEKDGNVRP